MLGSVKQLGRISQSATKMAGLIDQILDVAQLRIGQELALQLEPTNLVALTNRIASDFQSLGHVIVVDTAEKELVGDWDTARIERVICNLVNNSIKYSPDGSQIALALGRERTADGPWAVLTVSDQGVGIPADELARVFDRFYRGRNVVGKVHGTGIGLAGVRQIMEQHGGHVAVTSTEGSGTTVSVRFPLAA
jgi:signal transduction histidine kinase